MADKLLSIKVRGVSKKWSFTFYGDPKHLKEWREDGLDVYQIENVIPAWVVGAGLARPWCFLQDALNLRNPWGK
jgi:hypothetical protein